MSAKNVRKPLLLKDDAFMDAGSGNFMEPTSYGCIANEDKLETNVYWYIYINVKYNCKVFCVYILCIYFTNFET